MPSTTLYTTAFLGKVVFIPVLFQLSKHSCGLHSHLNQSPKTEIRQSHQLKSGKQRLDTQSTNKTALSPISSADRAQRRTNL